MAPVEISVLDTISLLLLGNCAACSFARPRDASAGISNVALLHKSTSKDNPRRVITNFLQS